MSFWYYYLWKNCSNRATTRCQSDYKAIVSEKGPRYHHLALESRLYSQITYPPTVGLRTAAEIEELKAQWRELYNSR